MKSTRLKSFSKLNPPSVLFKSRKMVTIKLIEPTKPIGFLIPQSVLFSKPIKNVVCDALKNTKASMTLNSALQKRLHDNETAISKTASSKLLLIIVMATFILAVRRYVSPEPSLARESDKVPELGDVQTSKDVARYLTNSKNDAELLDVEHQKKAMKSGVMTRKVDALIKHIGDARGRGEAVAPELQQLRDRYLGDGTLDVALVPTYKSLGDSSHMYIAFRCTKAGTQQLDAADASQGDPQRIFKASIPKGGTDVTDTPNGQRLLGDQRGNDGDRILCLGYSDYVISRCADVDGKTILHNRTTPDHALVGDVLYTVDPNRAEGTVSQCIIGVGKGHGHITGVANLATQDPLFGAMFKRADAVMAEMGKDRAANRSHDDKRLYDVGNTVKMEPKEWLIASAMGGSRPAQMLFNAATRIYGGNSL